MESEQEPQESLEPQTIHTVDIDSFEPIVHKWVDRGLVMSCEGAGHPNHRHFKIGNPA